MTLTGAGRYGRRAADGALGWGWRRVALLGVSGIVLATPGAVRSARAAEARPRPPATTSSAAAVVDVDQLFGAFARMPGLEARFVEEKKIAMLAKPLVSRGRLFFTRPGLLRRTVESPRRSTVIVTPTAVHIHANGEHKTIDLRRLADVGALVQSLVWILAGNRAAIEGVYRVRMSQDNGTWLLALEPKAAPLSKLLAQIRITGHGFVVSQIHVIEVSGDESVTKITSANPRRRFSEEERRRLFGTHAP